MNVHIDPKGKYFTPRVNKEPVLSIIRTTEHLIVGCVPVRPDTRLKDELSHEATRFFAVTDAYVYDATGERLLFESSFLLIAHHQVILLSPLEAVSNVSGATWHRVGQKGDE